MKFLQSWCLIPLVQKNDDVKIANFFCIKFFVDRGLEIRRGPDWIVKFQSVSFHRKFPITAPSAKNCQKNRTQQKNQRKFCDSVGINFEKSRNFFFNKCCFFHFFSNSFSFSERKLAKNTEKKEKLTKINVKFCETLLKNRKLSKNTIKYCEILKKINEKFCKKKKNIVKYCETL